MAPFRRRPETYRPPSAWMQDPAGDGCFRTEQKPPFPMVRNTPDSRYTQRKCLFKHCQRAEFAGPGWKVDSMSWGAEGRPGHWGAAWSGCRQAHLWQEGTCRGMLANVGPLGVRTLRGVLGKGHVWVYACAYCMVCSRCVCWCVRVRVCAGRYVHGCACWCMQRHAGVHMCTQVCPHCFPLRNGG